MKKKSLFLSMALASSGMAFGQATPTHPLDIDGLDFPNGTFKTWFPAWEVGTPPMDISKMDDEFYKSRTRPLPRISKENDTYDANPDAPYDRKFCGFYGATDPTDTWKTLPRYIFEGDNYSMWSYTDMFSNWTSPFFRCTAGLSDVAAKNGASVGCCWTIAFGESIGFSSSYVTGDNNTKFATMCAKNSDGTFKYAEKLVKLMKYYGINALGFNSEFNANKASMDILIAFFAECHKIAKELDWNFEVHWYAGTSDSGYINFDSGLSPFKNLFGTGDAPSVDMLFLNYNWRQDQLTGDIPNTAKSLNRSSYDVFAGFDIQGRGVRRTTTPGDKGWEWLKASEVSIGFWGAHKQNLLHESSTDYGTTDLSLQKAYLKKQELIANGGNNNPAVRPPLANVSGLGIAALANFHGLADLMTAKSTIQQLPFVTRFSMGNGQQYYNRGEVTFPSKWYNLGTQDFLPTWRWWITDANDQATEDNIRGFVTPELQWDDAWYGGSCLSLSGATSFSRVKLFKTLLDAKGTQELSIVYKPVGSKDSHMKLFVSLKGAVTDYKEIAVPAGKADEWNTFTAKLSELGVNSGQIALIGLVVEDTKADYKTYVGELALRDPATTFNAVKPAIKEVEILRGRHNAVDFKMRYAAKEETGEMKTYNDEVDTWYYEVFIQQKGEEPVLLTSTPSWAAYVIGAPIKGADKNREARFGVRAVSPNGDMYDNNQGEIAWSDYMTVPYDQPLTDLEIDRPVVKVNEEFTIKMADDMAPIPAKWEIINAATDKVVKEAGSVNTVTMTLTDIGLYDVRITGSDGKVNLQRSQIQVTPAATGAQPEITAIATDKAKAETNEDVKLSYTGRLGEGKVSRAVIIRDPEMLQVDGNAQVGKVYSYALWFKADKFDHLSNGTSLINKNTIKDKWPHNNWGDLWVLIRPEGMPLSLNCTGHNYDNSKSGPNEISMNVMGYDDHQNPWKEMISTGYSVVPGVWNHLVVTQDANNLQSMYFNGKLVAQATCTSSKRRSDLADARIDKSVEAPIHIGGSGVYRSGFCGSIDEFQIWNKALTAEEVLRCMNGYAPNEVPDGLQAYYTFETLNDNGTFPNLGKGSSAYTAQMVVAAETGGETTSEAYYDPRTANNNELGNPAIEGTLEIKTDARWTLGGGEVKSKDGQTATVVYSAPGAYDVTLTLSNMWGSVTKTEPELVTIEGLGAIGDTFADGELEVSTYNDIVSLRFAEGGHYTINIINLNGQVMQTEQFDGEAGGTATVMLNAQRGAYLVQVLLNGQQAKVVKLVK